MAVAQQAPITSFKQLDGKKVSAITGTTAVQILRRYAAEHGIQFQTLMAKDQFEASAKLGYGNYQAFEGEGMVNLPLSDKAALRLSGRIVEQEDGYWKSRLLPGETIGARNIVTGRAQLALRPTDAVDVDLKLEGLRSRSEMG